MKLLILLLAISRLSKCSLPVPLLIAHPVAYHGVTVGITPYSAPVNSHSQYHAQDIHGHYAYGYATGLSAQDEVKTQDGVTRGGYSYIDANGLLQTVQYISDPVHGFRVAATNLPKDLPEVAIARAQHLAQFEYIKAEHAAIAASRAHLPAVISPIPAPGAYIVPVKANIIAPVPAAHPHPVAFTPVVTVSSQYQAQDSLGQYSYGYADPNSAKSETKTADGVTRGGYSYIDANGILQTVQYVSDPVNGFRVAATNLPQAPSVTLIGPKVTATVVGPKDNNAAGVAIVPAVSAVPVQTHIDSIAVEQSPVLAQADIVQNANVPLVNPIGPGPYIQSNPNHEPQAVFANPELAAPFQHAAIPPHYAEAPIPVIHSQSVLHNQGNIHPQYANAYPVPHHDGGALVAPNHPSQILQAPEVYGLTPAYQIAPEHRGQIFFDSNYGPIPAQYASEHRGHIYADPNLQIHQNYQGLVADHRTEILAGDARGHILTADPRSQLLAGDQRGHILTVDPRSQFLAEDPRGHIFAADPRGQYSAEDPRNHIATNPHGHYLADGNLQALGDPNVQQVRLNPYDVATSPDYIANYQFPVGPINADTINNGPINQHVLNHGEGPARLALFSPDAVAVQQVHAPVGGAQVAAPEQQAFIVRVAEQESANADARDEGSHASAVTPPSGYYTQNIQY